MNKFITNINISTSDIDKKGTRRQFFIEGDKGAEFILQVINTTNGKFYNFKTKTFDSTTHGGVNNILKDVILGSRFTGTILFPSQASDTTYKLILMPNPSTDTEINRKVITKTINQFTNTTITLAYVTATTTKYSASPPIANKTSVGSAVITGATKLDVSGTVSTANTAGNAFGLRVTRQPVDSDFVFRKTTTLNGTTSSSASIVVTDVTDLVVGMNLVAVGGTNSLSGTPNIVSIDSVSKTIKLSSVQTFSDDSQTFTFDAVGSKGIFSATGIVLSTSSLSAKLGDAVTAKVRTAPSNSTTVNLDKTRGIMGGGHVTVTGINFLNTGANTVQSVAEDHDGSGADGNMVVQIAQQTTLAVNTVLTFKGSSIDVNIGGSIVIKSFSKTDRTISLLLDNFITPGAAS